MIEDLPRTVTTCTRAVSLCCAALVFSGPVALAGETEAVVELFTSQGCSSCPPADSTMAELARDPKVLALTFAVDYWDYLGWKDTFARPEFSKRQRQYAAARGDSAVYTPQAVINGQADVVGSDGDKIRKTIASLKASGGGLTVDVKARVAGDRIIVEIPAGTPPAQGVSAVWIAAYRAPESVEIGQGENSGRKVTYTNVVERWQVLGMWDGQAMTVELPLADIVQEDTAGCAVILQSKRDRKPGAILGATKIDLSGS